MKSHLAKCIVAPDFAQLEKLISEIKVDSPEPPVCSDNKVCVKDALDREIQPSENKAHNQEELLKESLGTLSESDSPPTEGESEPESVPVKDEAGLNRTPEAPNESQEKAEAGAADESEDIGALKNQIQILHKH